MTSNSKNLLDYIKQCNYYHMIYLETTAAYPNSSYYTITSDDAGPSHYWYTTKTVVWPNTTYNGGH